MNDLDVKRIVSDTVNELLKDNMIRYSDIIIYERMSERLREHYKKCDPLVAEALSKLTDHQYYEVLEMYYGDNCTLEFIAEEFDVDISTIVRNKKALCIKIFNMIN